MIYIEVYKVFKVRGDGVKDWLLQVAARLFALAIPFLIIIGVQNLATQESGERFFRTLADVILLLSVCKIGLDTYMPGSVMQAGRLTVSATFRNSLLVSMGLLIASAVGRSVSGHSFEAMLTVVVSIALLVCAEQARAKENYIVFYCAKAPATYVLCFLSAIVFYGQFGYTVLLFLTSLGAIYYVRSLGVSRLGEKLSGTILSSILSLLLVAVSWRDVFVARHFFEEVNLGAVVLASRSVQITNFVYMLANARVPVAMRKTKNSMGCKDVRGILAQGRSLSIVWSLFCIVIISAYVFFTNESEFAPSVIILIAGSLIVYFGNMAAVIIYHKKFSTLVLVNLVTICVYGVTILLLGTFIANSFLVIALASLVSQIASAFMLRQAMRRFGFV